MKSGVSMKSYDAGLEPLFTFTNYESVVNFPYDESKLNLDRMRDVLAAVENPQRGIPAVHVAGTKGKGSTSIFIESILRTAGVRTGLFTSPHLERIEQRFAVGGNEIATEVLVRVVQRLKPYLEQAEPKPTFFEIITAIAWIWFQEEHVEVPILEVGLGGRLDSTNLIEPAVCVITNIGFDHTRQLGETLDAIAWEKAGIIKAGVPVVTAAAPSQGLEVIRRRAEELAAPLHVVMEPVDLDLSAPGLHQRLNAACAAQAVRLLDASGVVHVTARQMEAGLLAARLPGRIERLAEQPTLVVDAAHNDGSARALAATLQEDFVYDRLILILGILADKQVDAVLRELLPACSVAIATGCDSPRAVTPEALAAQIGRVASGTECRIARDPAAALELARSVAKTKDLICVAGSTYLAGEVRALVGGQVTGGSL